MVGCGKVDIWGHCRKLRVDLGGPCWAGPSTCHLISGGQVVIFFLVWERGRHFFKGNLSSAFRQIVGGERALPESIF